MPANLDPFFRKLRSTLPSDRLEAARYFAEHATPDQENILREAASRESVLWIKNALRRAIARISAGPISDLDSASVNQDDLPKGFAAQVFAEALETTSSQLLHEIEPILGSLRLAAEAEIPEFESSRTRKSIERLDEFLAALSRLRRAASSPKSEEFSLDNLVDRCVNEVPRPAGLQVKKIGPQQCIVEGDSGLVAICVCNGLRNAVESTVASTADLQERPIAIAWGTTNTDYWVSIVDLGIGFKGSLVKAFEMGTTTKEGHLGMGLAIAEQAMISLGGRSLLVPNERGVRFEIRWPKKAG
jgi:signal transduction histidine kinase